MIVLDCQQNSEEWFEHRRGIPTASEASKLITAVKGDLSSQAEALIDRCIAEGEGLQTPDPIDTEWMLRGTELEPEARMAFRLITGHEIETPGFILNDDRTAGASPDGLYMNSRRGLEMKAPKPSTHIGYLRANKLPDTYKQQVHMSMVVTGIRIWTFFSYCPGLDSVIVDVPWDKYTDKVKAAVDTFVAKLAAERARLGLGIAQQTEQAA